MLKKLLSLSCLLSVAFIPPCSAEENTTEAAYVSSDEMALNAERLEKSKVRNEIAKQVYDPRNDALMREYVRNSNAIKKYMRQPEEKIDVSDKSAINRYIQKDAGAFYEPQKRDLKSAKENTKPIKVKYKSRASFDLSGE